MTRDRRGFAYPLEPMSRMTDWQILDTGTQLADASEQVEMQQATVERLQAEFAAARAKILEQRQHDRLLDISGQKMAHSYIQQIQQRLATERATLGKLRAARDRIAAAMQQLRKLADSLEEHRTELEREHDQAIAKRHYQEADENWLQRTHWRKNV